MFSFCRSLALEVHRRISLTFKKLLVEKRKYITEEELIEINALGQVLPGPTSTQTLTAIAYRLRGPNLAYLTLVIWMLPSVAIMTGLGILMARFETKQISIAFTRFIQPMAVGLLPMAPTLSGSEPLLDRGLSFSWCWRRSRLIL